MYDEIFIFSFSASFFASLLGLTLNAIRTAFEAPENCYLLSMDYSQIELRLIAHIADEKSMIQAFNEHLDIHTDTASKVFNISSDKISANLRRSAKAINFGIIYGISPFGLAKQLKCSNTEAKEFIDSFYNEKGYIDALCAIIKNKLQPQSNYLLFSYHGIPNRHLKKTDPTKNHCLQSKNCCDLESKAKPYCYKAQVIETSKLCAENLSLKSNEWGISFQSRIGPGWIEPFTDIELKELANQGIKNLDVVCPSFVIDNLETLEENHELFFKTKEVKQSDAIKSLRKKLQIQ